jgi:uncharacterized caspase-like protein
VIIPAFFNHSNPLRLSVRAGLVICHLVLCNFLVVTAAHAASKYALLIGINEYSDRAVRQGVVPLEYAANDARSIQGLLSEEYEVVVLENRGARREYILEEFRKLRTRITKDDSFILFFAGHGVRDPTNGQTYWLTYDTSLDELDLNGIRLEHLFDFIRDIKADEKLVLLDHCFSGDVIDDINVTGAAGHSDSGTVDTAASDAGGDGTTTETHPEEVTSRAPGTLRAEKMIDREQRRGVFPVANIKPQLTSEADGLVVLAAARHEAFELSDYGHGLFTEALIRALQTRRADSNPDGNVSMSELVEFMGTEVGRLASEANLAQDVIDVVRAINLSDWQVARLPPMSADAEEQKDQYMQVLHGWRNRVDEDDWITVQTVNICRSVLEKWVESLENDQTLSPAFLKIKKSIESHLALLNDPRFEAKTIAESLETEVLDLWEADNPT